MYIKVNTYLVNILYKILKYIKLTTFFQKQRKALPCNVLEMRLLQFRKNAFPTKGRNCIFATRFSSILLFKNQTK